MSSAVLVQRKGLGVGVGGLDVAMDGGLELGDGAMDAAAQGALGEQGEQALDLVDPGGRGRREVDVEARALGEPVADQLGLVACRQLSMMRWTSRSAGTCASTASRNLRNSRRRWRGKQRPMTVPAFTSSAANSEVVPWRV